MYYYLRYCSIVTEGFEILPPELSTALRFLYNKLLAAITGGVGGILQSKS